MFILITILFLVSGAAFIKWFHFMIQPHAMLDIIFGYQKLLHTLYNGNTRQQMLGKALGDCNKCMCFWFSILWFFVYYIFCKIFGHWLTNSIHGTASIVFVNLTWFICFQTICGLVCFFTITKLFKE